MDSKREKHKLLLEIINKSFCIDESSILESSIKKIDNIMNILNLKNNSKIIKVGHGTYSCVYSINNKILKVGFYKLNKLIIKHPKIVNVYYKDNIELLCNNNIIRVGIEIQDLAILSNNDDTNMLYNLYKDLRDDGILWTDVKPNNVGYVDKKLVVIDTDDCYMINNNDNKFKINYVNDIALKFNFIYNENMEGEGK